MYDFLHFIDSPDVREFNRNTIFTPAEQAVIISRSEKATVDDKLEALQYLADTYTEEEFHGESVNCEGIIKRGTGIRDVVLETIRVWKHTLEVRTQNDGVIYQAMLQEKERAGFYKNYVYFTDYERAYAYLLDEKKLYLEDDDPEDCILYGSIIRKKLNRDDGDEQEYRFDHDMRLVEVFDCGEIREGFCLLDDFAAYVPLPFQQGDIVRLECYCAPTGYGVISCDWDRPETTYGISMWISLDLYDREKRDFDYTDGGDCVLNYYSCSYEELPENEKMLKLISDVRKDKLDFFLLLHKFGRNELDQLLEWQTQEM